MRRWLSGLHHAPNEARLIWVALTVNSKSVEVESCTSLADCP